MSNPLPSKATADLNCVAWLTLLASLLPVTIGAVVTSARAGMAFADWPSSDGENLLLYNWLNSTGDKFLEHGHRLAAIIVGVCAIVLVVLATIKPVGVVQRGVAWLVLGTVIMQGLLGGGRVRLETARIVDGPTLAMIHGNFAVVAIGTIAALALLTSRWWDAVPAITNAASANPRRAVTVLGLLMIAQYGIGSLLRHLHSGHAWLIHPWLAWGVLLAAVWFAFSARVTHEPSLRANSLRILLLVSAQALLGLATWACLYGYPTLNIMAVHESKAELWLRSLHKVVGMITAIMVWVAYLQVQRVNRASINSQFYPAESAVAAAGTLQLAGAVQ